MCSSETPIQKEMPYQRNFASCPSCRKHPCAHPAALLTHIHSDRTWRWMRLLQTAPPCQRLGAPVAYLQEKISLPPSTAAAWEPQACASEAQAGPKHPPSAQLLSAWCGRQETLEAENVASAAHMIDPPNWLQKPMCDKKWTIWASAKQGLTNMAAARTSAQALGEESCCCNCFCGFERRRKGLPMVSRQEPAGNKRNREMQHKLHTGLK